MVLKDLLSPASVVRDSVALTTTELKTKKIDTAIAINMQELVCVSRFTCNLLVRQQLETRNLKRLNEIRFARNTRSEDFSANRHE